MPGGGDLAGRPGNRDLLGAELARGRCGRQLTQVCIGRLGAVSINGTATTRTTGMATAPARHPSPAVHDGRRRTKVTKSPRFIDVTIDAMSVSTVTIS